MYANFAGEVVNKIKSNRCLNFLSLNVLVHSHGRGNLRTQEDYVSGFQCREIFVITILNDVIIGGERVIKRLNILSSHTIDL